MKKVVHRLYLFTGLEILAIIFALASFAFPSMLLIAVVVGVPPASIILQDIHKMFAGLVLLEILLLVVVKHGANVLVTSVFSLLMIAFSVGVLYLFYKAIKEEKAEDKQKE